MRHTYIVQVFVFIRYMYTQHQSVTIDSVGACQGVVIVMIRTTSFIRSHLTVTRPRRPGIRSHGQRPTTTSKDWRAIGEGGGVVHQASRRGCTHMCSPDRKAIARPSCQGRALQRGGVQESVMSAIAISVRYKWLGSMPTFQSNSASSVTIVSVRGLVSHFQLTSLPRVGNCVCG